MSRQETGETTGKEVMATIVGSGAKDLVDVTVAAGRDGQSKTITATDGHPFWVNSQATWRDAGDLRPGDELLTPDGARVRVIDIHAYGAAATVHNLSIAASTPTMYLQVRRRFWYTTQVAVLRRT